ncbi:MAG TPA: HEAT repeat domain-containing protein [Chthonomonadaceae bacterium]|nr:HEAT repeat domain-containing protein [Chthonomonadaceae bacterium]
MPIWLSIDNSHVNRVRRAAAIALGRLRFPESVGALARGAVDRNASVRQASAQALSIVAPLLTSEHYGKLEAEAVPNLCNALVYYEKGSREMDKDIFPNFAKRREELELLEALEKVGDGRAIPTVQWIVQGGTDQDLRATARRILPLLLERERKEKEHQILLRGSEAPAASPEQMLRPATINMTEPPEVLLRPTVQSVDRHAG